MTEKELEIKPEIKDEGEERSLDKNYLEEIERLQEKINNSVPKEVHQKTLEEHSKVVGKYLEVVGTPSLKEEENSLEPSSQIQERFLNNVEGRKGNRELFEDMVKYRESVLEETGTDVWLDAGESDKWDEARINSEKNINDAYAARIRDVLKQSKNTREFNALMEFNSEEDRSVQKIAVEHAKNTKKGDKIIREV